MNRYLLVLFSLLLFLNCENKKRYDKSLTPFQKEMNEWKIKRNEMATNFAATLLMLP